MMKMKLKMASLRIVFIIASLSLLTFPSVCGQAVDTVCARMPASQDPNHTLPRFSDQFSVDVEAKFLERNKTLFIRQHYDKMKNRGQLTIKRPQMGDQLYYMDYDLNNILQVDADSSSCQVSPISSAKDSFIFGYRNDSGLAQMFSPSGAFHFGNVAQVYNGTSEVRGIISDAWVSCQYIDILQATALVVWYISRREEWDMQLGAGTIPLRMVATGVQVTPQNTQVNFTHIYDFFNYEQSVNPAAFVVPNGVYCPNRVTPDDKPFPQVPNVFYFVGEIIDPYKNQFSYMEEAYDNVSRVSAFRFKGDVTSLTGMNQYAELNDYNTGVSYILDTIAGSCSLSPVKDGLAAFSVAVNGQQVRLKTPREFFMDSSIQYQYAGSSVVRQIPCERWVATTTSAQGYNGTTVVVEWYFAAEDQLTWNQGTAATTYRIPVLFRLYIPGDITSPGYDFHVYYFNVMQSLAPLSNNVDISECFTGASRTSVRFRFNKANETVLRNNMILSVMAIKNGISLATGATPLRINNLQLYFNPDYVWVTFDLLDKAPMYHDVVSNDLENDLHNVWEMLKNAFCIKTMTFYFAAGVQVFSLTPEWNSLEFLPSDGTVQTYQSACGASVTVATTTGYSKGALAGLGVGMLVAGGAGGGVGGFFLLSRLGKMG